MKKLMAMLLMLLAVVMVGCNSVNKIWLFSFGQTKAEVEKTLKDNNYRYKDNDDRDGFIGSQVVEYMGVKWDGFMLSFKDGKLEQVSFRKADGEELTEEEAEKVVEQIDKRFGEHREDRTASREYGTVGWEWKKGDIHASFTRMFGGAMSMLTFFQKDDNEKQIKIEAQKPEVVEEIVETCISE